MLPEEQEQWKDVDPSMMSDEETLDSSTLKCCQPDWRLSAFYNFLDELDRRLYQTCQNPRKARVLGTPLKCPVPDGVKEWMTAQFSD